MDVPLCRIGTYGNDVIMLFWGWGKGLPLLGELLVLWKHLLLTSEMEASFSALPPASGGIFEKAI